MEPTITATHPTTIIKIAESGETAIGRTVRGPSGDLSASIKNGVAVPTAQIATIKVKGDV